MRFLLTTAILLSILIFFSLKTIAQNQNIEFEEIKFPDRVPELKKALKDIIKGDNIYTGKNRHYKSKGAGKYEEALKYYLSANDFNPNNSLLNYKIGSCYMYTVEKYKAVPYLEKAYLLNRNVKNDLPYILGQAYHYNYEFDKAIQKYNEYEKSLDQFDRDAYGGKLAKKIAECRNAKELVRVPVNVKITNLGGVVNTRYPEYSPIVNADQSIMFFTARKPNTTGRRIWPFDGKYYEDIYITYFRNGLWTNPKNPGRPLNSKGHDAIVGVSQDGKTLLIYKASPRDLGDIYRSKLKEDKYTRPRRLNKNINTDFHETSATFSPDGNTLYFVSDREGGYGGRDIWVSRKDSKGEWSKPENMGNTVNTSFDEEGVFMQADGKTLFFSSQGHNSIGGYDIFRTVNEGGKWITPKNLGYPINTPEDDVFISITKNGQHGYFASGKKGGYGDMDIYEIEFYETKAKSVAFKGKVIDGDTKLPVVSKMEIRDLTLNAQINTIEVPESGEFYATAPNNKPYQINVTAPDYSPYQENIAAGKDFTRVIYIYKLTSEKPLLSKGNVLDAKSKEPICKAQITVREFETKALIDTTKSDCVTGEYHSRAVKGLTYELLVTAPQYTPYKENVPKDKDVNKTIYLEKMMPLAGNLNEGDTATKPEIPVREGYVYDADTKKPVCSDIEIINPKSENTLERIKTDCPTGHFESIIPKGEPYLVKITAPEYEVYTEIIPPDKDVNKLYFINKPIGIPTGNVYDKDTRIPVCADLEIINNNTKATADKLKTDCPSGQYQSKVPKDSPYEIKVIAPDYKPYSEIIESGEEVNKFIFIEKIKTTAGNVYDAASKLPVCADIEIINTGTNTTAEILKTDCPSGEYKSLLPKDNPYEIKVNAEGYKPHTEMVPRGKDVNRIIYIEKTIPESIGFVFDADTKEPVPAEIEVNDPQTKALIDKSNSDVATGKYQSKVQKGKKYELSVKSKDYIPYIELVKPDEDVNRVVYVKKIQAAISEGKLYDITKAKSFVLPNILYDFDKYNLKPQYQDSLNNLINTMRSFPRIVIELGSHTDSRGTDLYNEKLSFNRAKSVVDYLISKGIEPDRLVAKGYGEKVPRVLERNFVIPGCNTKYKFLKGIEMTDAYINSLQGGKCEFEAAHQLNRRTTFIVLREDYIPGKTKSSKPVNIEMINK